MFFERPISGAFIILQGCMNPGGRKVAGRLAVTRILANAPTNWSVPIQAKLAIDDRPDWE
jgi:hypothetical protein